MFRPSSINKITMATLTGILIATTDRIGTIDPALVSRTDLAVVFRLNRKIRRQIWANCISESGSQNHITESNIDVSLADKSLDGHTITSIVQSASRIAQSEHRNLELADIRNYVRESNELSQYLAGVRGDTREWMRAKRWALDESPNDKESTEDEDEKSISRRQGIELETGL